MLFTGYRKLILGLSAIGMAVLTTNNDLATIAVAVIYAAFCTANMMEHWTKTKSEMRETIDQVVNMSLPNLNAPTLAAAPAPTMNTNEFEIEALEQIADLQTKLDKVMETQGTSQQALNFIVQYIQNANTKNS
jgi:hypothetical protein